MRGLILRNVEVGGRSGLDVRVADGRIAAIGARLPGPGWAVDGGGGALLPGLADHHIHLLGLAAQQDSVDLSDVSRPDDFATRITQATDGKPEGAWIRATGYHERMAGELTRRDLDQLAPRHRLRLQHQTGALWILNSAALASLGPEDLPACVERDQQGALTGRVWRGDAWLRGRIGAQIPPLAPVGRQLAAWGVTHLTDASVTTDAGAAALLAEAFRKGDLPQHLTLMSGGDLKAPDDAAFAVGPVKILLDDHDLPDLDDFIGRIAEARDWGRSVAVHCVAAGELALSLAAFESAGALPGDRIEHGGVIPSSAILSLREMGLTVVTQPGFVRDRGDRYLTEVAVEEQADLYRCASLLAAGVPVAASSDAPYGPADPWLGMTAAIGRRTRLGHALGTRERVSPKRALALYLDEASAPGRRPRPVTVGAPADLCLLDRPLDAGLATLSADSVVLTLLNGEVIYDRKA